MSMIDRFRGPRADRPERAEPIIRQAPPPPPRPRVVAPERMADVITTATAEVLAEVDNAVGGLLKVRDEIQNRNRVMIDAVDQHVRNNGQMVQALRAMGAQYINTMLQLIATAWQPEGPMVAPDAEAPKLAAIEREVEAAVGQDP